MACATMMDWVERLLRLRKMHSGDPRDENDWKDFGGCFGPFFGVVTWK